MTRMLTTFAAAALISALAACSGTQTADTSASLGAVSTDNSSLPACCASKKAAGKTCADTAKCGAAKDGAAPACCATKGNKAAISGEAKTPGCCSKATEANKAAISGEAKTPGCSKATKGNKAAISTEPATSGCCASKAAKVKKAAISGECPLSGGATPPCCPSKKADN